MKVSYIYHSCFMVETESVIVVYDYWQDHEGGSLFDYLAQAGKPVYFVVSHFHIDHFNDKIFSLSHSRYLLSYDVIKRRKLPVDAVYSELRPGHGYCDDCIKLHAFRSTDIGVCTLLTFPDNTTVFHAGDCNNWYFNNLSGHLKVTPDNMEKMYLSILRDVKNAAAHINYVMFPVDPRLGDQLLRGPSQWLDKIGTDHFFPMHFWDMHDLMKEGIEKLKIKYTNTLFYIP